VTVQPPEDRPDTIDIGPVTGIPIIDDDDPRFERDRAAWSAARRKAQAMVADADLLCGLSDPDWRVRHEVVDRAVARVADRDHLVSVLVGMLSDDSSEQVRDTVAMCLSKFDAGAVSAVLTTALSDESAGVRWAASFSLFQLGLGPAPPDF